MCLYVKFGAVWNLVQLLLNDLQNYKMVINSVINPWETRLFNKKSFFMVSWKISLSQAGERLNEHAKKTHT